MTSLLVGGLACVPFFQWFLIKMTYNGAFGCVLVILDAANMPNLLDDC